MNPDSGNRRKTATSKGRSRRGRSQVHGNEPAASGRAIEEFYLRALAEHTEAAVYIKDTEGRYLLTNHTFEDWNGLARGAAIGKTALDIFPAQQAETFGASDRMVMESGREIVAEQNPRPGRKVSHVLSVKFPITDDQGVLLGLGGVATDISQRKLSEEQAWRHANYDALTGLPNRKLLSERFAQSAAAARRHDTRIGVLYLDLDGFKEVNDRWGHAAGDEILRQAAKRFETVVRGMDTVARLGGDEFAVMVTDLSGPTAVKNVAQHLIDSLALPLPAASHKAVLSASVGISLFPEDGGSLDELLKCADKAMYRAKRQGPGAFHFYTSEWDEEAHRLLSLESDLLIALSGDGLALHYQPIFDLVSGKVVAVEALLRWLHPKRGDIPPREVFQLAETTELSATLDNWVLDRACRQAASWLKGGAKDFRLSVNLAPSHLRAPGIVRSVTDTLSHSGLPPDRLTLEFPGTVLADRSFDAVARLNELRAAGVSLVMDDFGDGQASLTALRTAPVDAIKVGQGVMAGIGGNPGNDSLLRAIIGAARCFQIATVGKGIETEKQRDIFSDNGCLQGQGFLFARPAPATDLTPALVLP